MLFSATLSAALLSVGALAAPANRAEASALSCNIIPGSTPSSLKLFVDSANTTFPAGGRTLGLDPVRDANADPLLQAYNGNAWSFLFYECASTYMGYSEVTYPGDVHRYYGQLRQVPAEGDPTSCLTVNPGQSLITQQECSTVDDVSQTTQWWEITRDNTSDEPSSVSFLGNITYHEGPVRAGFYSTGFGYLGGNQVVSAIYHNELNPRTDYQIKL